MKHNCTTSLLQTALFSLLFIIGISASATLRHDHSNCDHVHVCGLQPIYENMNTSIAPPEGFEYGADRDVTISVTYNGFSESAQTAFQYAVDIWASLLTSDVPILVEATWEDIPGTTLGYAGAEAYFINFAGALESDTYYPSALADKLAGFDVDPGNPDINASFDSGTDWYFGLDANPGPGEFDFVTVVLHELGHGLGVVGSGDMSGSIGYMGLGFGEDPIIYDTYVENGSGVSITNYSSGSTTLGNQLTSNNLFWNGAEGVAGNAGSEPSIYAPSSWEPGSSYSHVDEDSYPAGTANSLMTPFLGWAEANHDPGPIIMGLMDDIGWTVEDSDGGGGCILTGVDFSVGPCNGNDPAITMFFDIAGGCTIAEICFSEDGGAFSCEDISVLETGDGDGVTFNAAIADTDYDFYFVLSDGTVSSTYSYSNGNCSSLETICDCAGTEHTIGVLAWLGDGFADDSQYEWEGQIVDFDCSDWGYDCGDIAGSPSDDPYNVCGGGLPPNNGCGGGGDCVINSIDVQVDGCGEEGTDDMRFYFDFDGDCIVQEICASATFEVNEFCFDLSANGLESGDDWGIIGLEVGLWEFWYTLSDGTMSPIGTLFIDECTSAEGCTNPFATNYDPTADIDDGTCIYNESICDCDGTSHTIGVLVWIGDGFADDSQYEWEGQIVDFDCADWGYDCGDIAGAPSDDPYNVCGGGLPPNNGCEGDIFGCTDPTALNYDPNATIDDGSCIYDQDCVIEENFDNYLNGSYVAQSSPNITTWNNNPGSVEDAFVTNDFAFSEPHSMMLEQTDDLGGPTDIYIPLGDATGTWNASWMMYVPVGFGAYVNVQEDVIAGVEWGVEVFFNDDGTVDVLIDALPVGSGSYLQNTWNQIELVADLNADNGVLLINGVPIANIPWDFDYGGVNFFPFQQEGTALYFVDDFQYCESDAELGCTDFTATNYDFGATLDDGSCLYDDDCLSTMTVEERDCIDFGGELLPSIEMEFTITAGCTVEDWCIAASGAAYDCFNLPELEIIIEDGDILFFNGMLPNTSYSIYYTLSDGSVSDEFFIVTTDCLNEEYICDCDGNQHTIGATNLLGNLFLDNGDGSSTWVGVPVNFDCETWGYDCGDGGIFDDPNGVCQGNLPPNNGCDDSSCLPLGLDIYQEDCADNGFGLLPLIGFEFSIGGDCNVEDFCFQVDGGGYTCFNLPTLEDPILIFDGDPLFLNNTTPDGLYEFYYTTSDGSVSPVFVWQNGNCENEETICDCDGNQHSIGVLGWLGDGAFDDGSFTWDGVPVNFDCETWGYDCGDGGTFDDPNGVCEGNLPPNNGCVGEILGCTDVTAVNYNPDATVDDGSCYYEDVLGCTDSTALNYNPAATLDDGSCVYPIEGCTDPTASNYNPDATIDDGSCVYEVMGCTDIEACNYNPNATLDDGSCDYSCYGCTDPNACNYDNDATINDGTCDYSCYGCTDPEATNYDPAATIDDGSCVYGEIEGCTDSNACNYDPFATVDDGSCEYVTCAGCTDPLACNYDFTATIDDGSCDYECYGCTDSEATNYDPDATIDDGSCVYGDIPGCMDPNACNYDEYATIDDGSCEYETCAGCTDSDALNYDPTATIDDGSCVYDCEFPLIDYTTFCEDGETDVFYIEMDINDLGNGAPYLVSNNQNDDEIELTFNGIIELGPFDNDDQVVVTVESLVYDCLITSPLLTDNCTPDNVGKIAFESAMVYPNPNDGRFFLSTGDHTGPMTIDIYDIAGKLLVRDQITVVPNEQRELNLRQDLAFGTYLMRTGTDQGTEQFTLIVR